LVLHAAREKRYTELWWGNFLVNFQTGEHRSGAIIPINTASHFPQCVEQCHKAQNTLLENHHVTFFDTVISYD